MSELEVLYMNEENKKAILLFIVASLLSTIFILVAIKFIIVEEDKGIGCSDLSGLCIEVFVKGYSDSKGFSEGPVTYPSLRQGDYLRLDEIRIHTNGEETRLFRIYTYLFPEEGHIVGAYSENYGEQSMIVDRDLKEDDIYIIKRTKYQQYVHFYNGQEIKNSTLYGIELYKPGAWIFGVEPQDKNGSRHPGSYTTLKNGRWRGDVFFVGSRYEVDALIENKLAVIIAIIAFIVISIFTIFQTWKDEIGDLLFESLKKIYKLVRIRLSVIKISGEDKRINNDILMGIVAGLLVFWSIIATEEVIKLTFLPDHYISKIFISLIVVIFVFIIFAITRPIFKLLFKY